MAAFFKGEASEPFGGAEAERFLRGGIAFGAGAFLRALALLWRAGAASAVMRSKTRGCVNRWRAPSNRPQRVPSIAADLIDQTQMGA